MLFLSTANDKQMGFGTQIFIFAFTRAVPLITNDRFKIEITFILVRIKIEISFILVRIKIEITFILVRIKIEISFNLVRGHP